MCLGADNIVLVTLRGSRHRFFFLSLAAGDGGGGGGGGGGASSGFCEK